MKTLTIKNELYELLLSISSDIQPVRTGKVSPGSAIYFLVEFKKAHEKEFKWFVENNRRFDEDYSNKITSMQNHGIPTTQDLKGNMLTHLERNQPVSRS